ncbi:MAG: hypothetical protein R3275_07025 [Saprospiraceae bacterium]|nr:hypothetical protein [Saprospiraceae bacterium]
MSTNKILLAGLIGAVVAYILGFLTWGLLLADFFEANSGSATGVMRAHDEMLHIPMIVGHLTWGLLFAIIYGRWASISTFATGAKAGAVIGLLVGLSFDLINYASTHILTPTSVVVDVIAMTIISAIVGGVVGWYYGRGN